MTTLAETGNNLTNTAELLDVRDIIARVEQLEQLRSPRRVALGNGWDNETAAEMALLESLLDDLRGNGGGEQWRGDGYPSFLIRSSFFESFARQEAEENPNFRQDATRWPYTCIDWEQAAREFQMDYTTAEFDGVTYWYR